MVEGCGRKVEGRQGEEGVEKERGGRERGAEGRRGVERGEGGGGV